MQEPLISGRVGRLAGCLVIGLSLLMGNLGLAADPPAGTPKLADYFGFLPLEIYKLERRIGNLTLKDVDGDNVKDIILGDNARSRIDLLLSTKRPAGEAETRPFRTDVNDLTNDQRMRLVSLPVNKEVVSLATGDFNGDGKADLAYYGTPAELEILFNEGAGTFGSPKKISVGDAVEGSHSLAVGDLDRDGRDDLVLLAENDLIFLYQTAPGVLSEPERVPHTADNPRMVKLLDLDGNGGLDLLILDSGTDHPIHVRFAAEDRKLGPEQRFALEGPRAIAFGQIDGKGGAEVLTVEGQSGRGKVLTLDESESGEEAKWGRLIFFGLPQGTDRGRALAVGDLDGDHKKDVVVTDPANAQVWVYRQSGKSGLSAGQSFPGLLGSKAARLADLDGDGKDEVYVLSEQEKQIGRSTFENGRLGFPTALPIQGEPVAIEVADIDSDKTREILYAVRTKPGADSFELRSIGRQPSGSFVEKTFGSAKTVPLTGLSGAPTELRALDVNRDGQSDILVFGSYGSPLLLLGRKGEAPAPFVGSLGPLAGATPAGMSQNELDGPALIVAQNTFARRIQLDAKGNWDIKDQYNAGRNSAQIQGAAAIDLKGDAAKEIVLLDKPSKSLLFLEKKEGVYRPAGSLSIGSLNFEGMHVGDFDGDGRDDLLIAGTGRFAILQTGRKGLRLRPIASYESKRNEARLGDLAAGDLNADGVPDIVFTDIAESSLEIASYIGINDLLPAVTFRVFERKSFRGVGDLAEPRDLAIGDVDGDGRDDLVLLAHDRVLVLRQDPGPAPKKTQEANAKPTSPTVSGR